MSRNNYVVPEAKDAMNRFKMEAASDVGVNLKAGYNGDLTARQAGSIGGQMVNTVCPVRTIRCERQNRVVAGHLTTVTYLAGLVV